MSSDSETALYVALVRALLDGNIPHDPTTCRRLSAMVRSRMDGWPLSWRVQEELFELETMLRARAQDPSLRVAGDGGRKWDALPDMADAIKTPGMHVYVLDHYLAHAYEPRTGYSLYAVGYFDETSVDLMGLRDPGTLPFPEDLMLARLYPAIGRDGVEEEFHCALHAAGQAHRRGSVEIFSGWQWYLTGLNELDEVAVAIGLPVWQPVELGTPR